MGIRRIVGQNPKKKGGCENKMRNHNLQKDKTSKSDIEKKERVEMLVKKYNNALAKKRPEYHQVCRELAQAMHELTYKSHTADPPSNMCWNRWKGTLSKFIRRVFKMLKQHKVNDLSTEQKEQLERLSEEYEAAVKANNLSARNVNKETNASYSQATRNLAEFITKHNLNR